MPSQHWNTTGSPPQRNRPEWAKTRSQISVDAKVMKKSVGCITSRRTWLLSTPDCMDRTQTMTYGDTTDLLPCSVVSRARPWKSTSRASIPLVHEMMSPPRSDRRSGLP